MKKVLVAFVQLQDFTLTDVSLNLIQWAQYYKNHPELDVEIRRFRYWGFEHNFNRSMKEAIEEGFDYLFQFDADMIGEPCILERLVAHDKECVGVLFFERGHLHYPRLWNVEQDTDGEIKKFWNVNPVDLIEAINKKELVKSDTRASGFTLFKCEAMKQIDYPFGEIKPNRNLANEINGYDVDVTWKLTKKFGGVWTDPSPDFNVKHITFRYVSEADAYNK